MARGMAAGEGIVSQANSAAYDEGYDRIFGRKEPARGRWVQDPATGELVDASTYVPPAEAKDAPVLAGRFYEGVVSPIDGTVIQTRAQYREHMRKHGVTNASDFRKTWADAEARRERYKREGRIPVKGLRESLERKFHEIQNKRG